MWLIAITIASTVMGMTLLTPALPLIQQELSATSSAVQLLLTLYLGALAIGQLVYGTLSDRVGRRSVLVFGAALYCVGGALAVFVTKVEWLMLCRIVQGLGGAACLSMGRAIVNDCFDRQDAAKYMSTIQIIQAIAPMLALGAGGIMAQLWGWEAILGIMSISGFVVFICSLMKI